MANMTVSSSLFISCYGQYNSVSQGMANMTLSHYDWNNYGQYDTVSLILIKSYGQYVTVSLILIKSYGQYGTVSL